MQVLGHTWVIGPVYDPQSVFFGPKKMHFMQIESVLQIKNWSEPAKNRFSVALLQDIRQNHSTMTQNAGSWMTYV